MSEAKKIELDPTSKVTLVKEKAGPWWNTKIIAESLGNKDRRLFLKISFRDMVAYVTTLFFITVLCMAMASRDKYRMKDMLQDQFIERNFETADVQITFDEIRNAADFWAYLEYSFFDSFYWDYWYDDETLPETSDEDENILYENKLIGVPRLRQVKVLNNSCTVHDYFRRSILACHGEYAWSHKNTMNFGPGKGTAWTYHYPNETDSITYWGKVNYYDGGGFYQDLSLKKAETQSIIMSLKKNLWITRATRCVFLDFTVYNVNLNLFCVIKLVFEFPPTGGIIPTSHFSSQKLIRFHNLHDQWIHACELGFFLMVVYYTAETIREFLYLKWKAMKHFWKYVDIVILCLSYTFYVLMILRYHRMHNHMKELIQTVGTYANFEAISAEALHHKNVGAVVCFFTYMKAFKYITFNRTLSQLNNTLNNCAGDILAFSVMFMIIFLAYAELGYLLFGSQIPHFGSFGLSTFTLLRTILGDFDYSSIEEADRILAPIFFLSFIFFVFFILLNMFLAIITDTYSHIKTELSVKPGEMQMYEYVLGLFYRVLRKFGCGKWITVAIEKTEKRHAMLEEVRKALHKCGFTNLEIETFFKRFNIDPDNKNEDYTAKRIIELLTADQPKETADEIEAKNVPPAIDKFVQQKKRVSALQDKLDMVTDRIDLLMAQLAILDNRRRLHNVY